MSEAEGDRPGREGVAEAVGMNARDTGAAAGAVKQHTERMGSHHRLESGGQEERTVTLTAEAFNVIEQSIGCSLTETHPALLLPLTVSDERAPSISAS